MMLEHLEGILNPSKLTNPNPFKPYDDVLNTTSALSRQDLKGHARRVAAVGAYTLDS
jgi:hypothetical protein